MVDPALTHQSGGQRAGGVFSGPALPADLVRVTDQGGLITRNIVLGQPLNKAVVIWIVIRARRRRGVARRPGPARRRRLASRGGSAEMLTPAAAPGEADTEGDEPHTEQDLDLHGLKPPSPSGSAPKIVGPPSHTFGIGKCVSTNAGNSKRVSPPAPSNRDGPSADTATATPPLGFYPSRMAHEVLPAIRALPTPPDTDTAGPVLLSPRQRSQQSSPLHPINVASTVRAGPDTRYLVGPTNEARTIVLKARVAPLVPTAKAAERARRPTGGGDVRYALDPTHLQTRVGLATGFTSSALKCATCLSVPSQFFSFATSRNLSDEAHAGTYVCPRRWPAVGAKQAHGGTPK
jgi:hypothetical protein